MRPSTYTEEVIAKAEDYLLRHESEYGDLVPIIEGLCIVINRARSTVYKWASEPDKYEISDILERIKEKQAKGLVNGGLSNTFNPAITKMMLSKHGYAEETKTDLSSQDGSMTPTVVERVIVDNETTD